jgi:DNA-binding response OmpR family regulator
MDGSNKQTGSKDSGPVLIVEDDRKTASLVALYLEREGFKTIAAHDGDEALKLAERYKPIFVVLDLMLPKLDGWEVCRTIRRASDVPILILTAREEEMDRVLGLSLGADDYVVKPFSPRELVARVKAILRRTRSASREEPKTLLSFGRLVLDAQKRRVTLNARPISLTRFEYNLLSTLMASPGRVFSRDELLASLYPSGEAVIDRVIDVHIGKLRQKIEDDISNPRYILTVRGLGYRFADEDHP